MIAGRPTTRTQEARDLFAGIGPTYDRMGALLSFGQDPRWRRFLASRVPMGTTLVLDVATGTGLVARALARDGRARVIVGLDQSEAMLRAGRDATANPTVVLAQAERLPFADGAFDALTVTYLLRYVDDPAATMRELARVVRPGGVIASLEFAVPDGPVSRPCWWLYTRIVMPTVGRLVSPEWRRVGAFLGPSIEDFWRRSPLETQRRWWADAGMSPMRWRRMSLGGGMVSWAVREG
jgi:demethylmenaquinone methyltransferase/2-methoxy-6-polyprenyl-1,4-benzoquinol methylase